MTTLVDLATKDLHVRQTAAKLNVRHQNGIEAYDVKFVDGERLPTTCSRQ